MDKVSKRIIKRFLWNKLVEIAKTLGIAAVMFIGLLSIILLLITATTPGMRAIQFVARGVVCLAGGIVGTAFIFAVVMELKKWIKSNWIRAIREIGDELFAEKYGRKDKED